MYSWEFERLLHAKKDQREPQLSTHLSLNLKPENESCDIFVNCLMIKYVYQPTQTSLTKNGNLTGSNCLSTISNQLLVKYKLFLGATPRSRALIITTEQRYSVYS